MDKQIKNLIKWIIIIIAFYIFSNFLINVGLNSNYKDMKRTDSNQDISIYQAQVTKVNGRIRGIIQTENNEGLNGKYVKFEFFSKRNKLLGEKYIQINTNQENGVQPIELYFKLQDVDYYNISIADEKPESSLEIGLLPKDMTRQEIIAATVIAYLIFW